METKRYEVRVTMSATMDFVVLADAEWEAKSKIRDYLAYTPASKKPRLQVKTKRGDTMTHAFVSEVQIEDVNEI